MDYKKEDKELQKVDKQGNVTTSVQIPIGKASVKQMIDAGFYADKTYHITKLFQDEGTYYFFIRPRRFGKSLLLDTIDQIARCNKELLKACAIYADKTYQWKKYPVIWLDFSELVKDSPQTLKKSLNRKLYNIANLYQVHDKNCIFINNFDNIQELKDGVRDYIKHYNYNRFHSTIGYKKTMDLYLKSIQNFIPLAA